MAGSGASKDGDESVIKFWALQKPAMRIDSADLFDRGTNLSGTTITDKDKLEGRSFLLSHGYELSRGVM